jgi:iduronate 2-sulfatase
MKKIIVTFSVLAIALIVGFKHSEEPKLNVLFIIADDLRPELGTFGATHIKSPNIDKLASGSAVFERAYCNIPVCGASRASLLSGIRPGRFRFYEFNDFLNNHYPGAKSMPRIFKENGYTTISNGKIFHNSNDEKDAWDEIWQAKSVSNLDWISKENLDLLNNEENKKANKRATFFENVAEKDEDYKDGKMALKVKQDLQKFKESGKPFFLTVGFHKPHLPFNAPKKYWDMYDISKINLPENYSQPASTPRSAFHNSGEMRAYNGIPNQGHLPEETAKKAIHGYYACVSFIDAQVGIIMAELNRLGLDKNTVVVLLGDHGWNLGNHQLWNKHSNFASSLSTPLMIKIPNKTAGQRIKNVVEFIDILPTLTQLTKLPLPTIANGESLVPLIEQEKRKKNFAISRWKDALTLIKDQYFYTEWFDEKDKQTSRMLFDHKTDPLELNNLAENPKYDALVNELAALMRKNRGGDFWVDRRTNKDAAVKE